MAAGLPRKGPHTALVARGRQERLYAHGGKKRMVHLPQPGPGDDLFRERNRLIASWLLEGEENTDWVARLEHAVKQPSTLKILRRIGVVPRPDGYFGDVA
jgi:hypothetical protein